MRKLEEILMDFLYSILLILCLIFVLAISIVLCIICTISWSIYHLFKFIFDYVKSFWVWILNTYQKMIDIAEGTEDKEDNQDE